MKSKQTKSDDYDYRDTNIESEIIAVGKNGKFGYINRAGEAITPLKYDKALNFGMYAGTVCLNGKWGLVNECGQEIIPFIYDGICGYYGNIVELNGKYGYIDRKTGTPITPVKYDCVENRYFLDKTISRELAKVKLDGKCGCVNAHGAEIIPLKYDEIEIPLMENYVIARLNGKWGYVGKNGIELTAIEYDETEHFREGRARVKINRKWGFVDSDGTKLTAVEYDRADYFCEGRARVKKNGKYGFIDDKGTEIIAVEYDDAERFYEGHARVKKNGKYGFIDSEGVFVIPAIYDDCDLSVFRDSASYRDGKCEFCPIRAKRNGKYGFIDIKGKEIIPFAYDGAMYVSPSLLGVKLNDKWGFIDASGKETIPYIYEDCHTLYACGDRLIAVKLNGKWGIIDQNSNIVAPCRYDKIMLKRNVSGWLWVKRDGKKFVMDTKGAEWFIKKNPDARTFKDCLKNAVWSEIEKYFTNTIYSHYREFDKEAMPVWKTNFNNFKTKQPKPSDDIIRIFVAGSAEMPTVKFYRVKGMYSVVLPVWAEVLDMEVRVEDGLRLSDSEIVALVIFEVTDEYPMTEETFFEHKENKKL